MEKGFETVTIINTTDADVNLEGLFLADTNGQQALSGSIVKGETIRINIFKNLQLSNIRDSIMIVDSKEQIIDQVKYELRNLPEEGHTMVF